MTLHWTDMVLKNYQKSIVEQLSTFKNFGLFCEPGKGKTLIVLTLAKIQKVTDVLVICRENKRKDWERDLEGQFRFDVINFSNITKYEVSAFLKNPLIIVDESQNIKTPDGAGTKVLLKWKGAGHRFALLTGTPQHHSYMDYFSSLVLLGIYKFNYATFKRRYMQYERLKKWDGTVENWPTMTGYIRVDELQDMLHSPNIAWYWAKSEFPPIIEEIEFKRPTIVKQITRSRLYQTSKGELIQLDSAGAKNKYGRMLETGYFMGDIIDTYKMDYAMQHIFPEFEKIVIACNYTDEIKGVSVYLRKLGIAHNIYMGSIKEELTENVIIINCNAGGSGINELANFDCMIMHSIADKYVDFRQTPYRIDRFGQTKPPYIFFFLSPGDKKQYLSHMVRLAHDDHNYALGSLQHTI